MRRVERWVRLVHHVLTIVIGLLPDRLARCVAEMGVVRARLGTDIAMRTLAAAQLVTTTAVTAHTRARLSNDDGATWEFEPRTIRKNEKSVAKLCAMQHARSATSPALPDA